MTGQNIEEMSLTKVTWARGNQQGKNLEEVLGGNFQTLNLDSLGKLNDFDVNNESGEYYSPYADEFSAHDKIYEEENELNSSTNKDDSVKLSKEESIFAKSQKNFKRDQDINMRNEIGGHSNRNINNPRNYISNSNRNYQNQDFYNTNTFRRNPKKYEDFSQEIFNTRVQDAMKRIEKKYSHKNKITGQEVKSREITTNTTAAFNPNPNNSNSRYTMNTFDEQKFSLEA